MTLIGRLHPLLIHFPIALAFAAAALESVALVTADERWRWVAAFNIRAAAACGIVAIIAGWQFAREPGMAAMPLLLWHRWLGIGALVALTVAAGTSSVGDGVGVSRRWVYRTALFGGAVLIAVTAHLGGVLVWGATFLHL